MSIAILIISFQERFLSNDIINKIKKENLILVIFLNLLLLLVLL